MKNQSFHGEHEQLDMSHALADLSLGRDGGVGGQAVQAGGLKLPEHLLLSRLPKD